MAGRELGYAHGDLLHLRGHGVAEVVEVAHGLVSMRLADGSTTIFTDEDLARDARRVQDSGLAALRYRDPDLPARLANQAPLRLIAAALVDRALAARPADIQAAVAGDLGDTTWATWWKKVRPALIESDKFTLGPRGFRLRGRTDPDSIPERSLADLGPARVSVTKIDPRAAALRCDIGELQFVDLPAADRHRVLARLLAIRAWGWLHSRSDGSPIQFDESLVSLGARGWRAVFRAANPPVGVSRAYLAGRLTGAIGGHAMTLAAGTPTKPTATDLRRLIEGLDGLSDIFVDQPWTVELEAGIARFTQVVVQLGLGPFSGSPDTSLQGLLSPLTVAAAQSSQAAMTIARAVAETDAPSALKCRFIHELLVSLAPDSVGSCAWAFLKKVPNEAAEAVRSIVESSAAEEMLSTFQEEVTAQNASTARAIGALAARIHSSHRREEERRRVLDAQLLAFALDTSSPADTREGLARTLRASVSRSLRGAEPLEASTGLLGLIDEVFWQLTETSRERERRGLRESERRLSDQDRRFRETVQRLEAALDDARARIERGDQLRDEMARTHRESRERLEIESKRSLLELIASELQDALLTECLEAKPAPSLRALVGKLRTFLDFAGVREFGQLGSSEEFDPRIYSLVPGMSVTLGRVRVVSPGFVWRASSGDEVLLAKARVVPEGRA